MHDLNETASTGPRGLLPPKRPVAVHSGKGIEKRCTEEKRDILSEDGEGLEPFLEFPSGVSCPASISFQCEERPSTNLAYRDEEDS